MPRLLAVLPGAVGRGDLLGLMRVWRFGVAVAIVAACLVTGGCRAAGSDTHLPPAASEAAGTAWLIFIDDLHIQFRHTGLLRPLLAILSKELIREGDILAVAWSGPSTVPIPPTADRRVLDAQIRSVTGIGLGPSNIADVLARGKSPNEIDYRAGLALSAARELVAVAGGVQARRKAVIWISNGHGFDPPPYSPGNSVARLSGQRSPTVEDLRLEFAALTREATRAGVNFFAVDPWSAVPTGEEVDRPEWHSYYAATRRNLRALSEQTGGSALLDIEASSLVRSIRERMAESYPER